MSNDSTTETKATIFDLPPGTRVPFEKDGLRGFVTLLDDFVTIEAAPPALDDDEVAAAPPADDREVLVPDGWGDLINDAFYDLGVARKDHNDAVGQLENARAFLDDVRVDLIVNGLVEGKNAEAREADLASKCQSEIKRVRSFEHAERDERLKLELAKDAVRRLEMLIALRGK